VPPVAPDDTGSRPGLTGNGQSQSECIASAEPCSLLLDAMGDGVIMTDVGGRICYLNAVASELTGWRSEEAIGQSLGDCLPLIDETTGEEVADPTIRCFAQGAPVRLGLNDVLVRPDGTCVPIDGSVGAIRGSNRKILGAVLVLRNVHAVRALLRQVAYQASHDTLTRLVNRREFERRLTRVLGHVSGTQQHALLFMDMDRFKRVNDTCGHLAGDELLRQVAQLFLSAVRDRDTLARVGGDEFALLLEHCPQPKALQVADKLRCTLNRHTFYWQGVRFSLGVSIGVVAIRHGSLGLSEILAAADRACYAAKREGRDGVQVSNIGS
jgi:diguanylate cyclase (GGDEF)-like protein/PAS domain S-box-containing protein